MRQNSRRDFLRIAGAGAAVLAASSLEPSALAEPIEPMQVGVFGLDYTFWTIWADLLSPKGRRLGTQLLRIQPAYVWDKDLKRAQQFAEQWECKVVERFDGMIGKVDAVLNGELTN